MIVVICKNEEESWIKGLPYIPEEALLVVVNYEGKENSEKANNLIYQHKNRKSFRIGGEIAIQEGRQQAKSKLYDILGNYINNNVSDENETIVFVKSARYAYWPKIKADFDIEKKLVDDLYGYFNGEENIEENLQEESEKEQKEPPKGKNKEFKFHSAITEKKQKEEKKENASKEESQKNKSKKADQPQKDRIFNKSEVSKEKSETIKNKEAEQQKKNTLMLLDFVDNTDKNKNEIEGSHVTLDHLLAGEKNGKPEHVRRAETELLIHYLKDFHDVMDRVLTAGTEDCKLRISDYHNMIDLAYRAEDMNDFKNSVNTLLNSRTLDNINENEYKTIKRIAKRYVNACNAIYQDKED